MVWGDLLINLELRESECVGVILKIEILVGSGWAVVMGPVSKGELLYYYGRNLIISETFHEKLNRYQLRTTMHLI